MPGRQERPRNLDVGYLYGSTTPDFEKKSRERMSESIRNNPNVELDPFKEGQAYITRQDSGHRRVINTLAEEAGTMDPSCRLSICIPAAGHQEGENIYRTLENYSEQTARLDKFEIVVLVNRPDKDEQGRPVVPDKTLDEIERFRKDYPKLRVRLMNVVLPKEEARMVIFVNY